MSKILDGLLARINTARSPIYQEYQPKVPAAIFAGTGQLARAAKPIGPRASGVSVLQPIFLFMFCRGPSRVTLFAGGNSASTADRVCICSFQDNYGARNRRPVRHTLPRVSTGRLERFNVWIHRLMFKVQSEQCEVRRSPSNFKPRLVYYELLLPRLSSVNRLT